MSGTLIHCCIHVIKFTSNYSTFLNFALTSRLYRQKSGGQPFLKRVSYCRRLISATQLNTEAEVQIESKVRGNDESEAESENMAEIVYDKRYEFDYFSRSGWFIGKVMEVNEEEDLRVVELDDKDNKPAMTVSVKELDSRFEEPELGDIGFRFVKKSRKYHHQWKSY